MTTPSAWTTLDEMYKESLELIQQAINTGYLSFASDLQKQQVRILEKLLDRIQGVKTKAQDQNNELEANSAYVMQSYIYGVIRFLMMWIYLKQNKWIKAWEALVEAQGYIQHGIRHGEMPRPTH